MPNFIGTRVIGPKTVAAIINIAEYSYEFNESDFYTVFSATNIQGPFSLDVDIDATLCNVAMYFGIDVYTSDGMISVGDRKHLAFVPANQHVTIGSSSIAYLANIPYEVEKIIVRCYFLNNLNTTVAPYISLFIGAPKPGFSALPYLGADTRALSLSDLFTNNVIRKTFAQTLGNHAFTTQWLYTVPAAKYAILEYANINIIEQAAIPVANATALIAISAANELGRTFTLNAIGYRILQIQTPIKLQAGETLVFQTVNTTAINAVFRGDATLREYS